MTSPAEAAYRRLVAALWVLVRTAGVPGAEAELRAVAADCHRRLVDVLAGGTHFVLQEHGGVLFANGLRIRPDVASFAATAGITALLQDNDVSELLLLPDATPGDLEILARVWHESASRDALDAGLRRRGCAGVHVAHGKDSGGTPIDAAVAPAAMSAPSQLGAVFTMQRFAAALGPAGPFSGVRARAVLQTVLHRLLWSPAGLEPLGRLQADSTAHAEAVRACVLAVRTAEVIGWDDERSLAAGTAALLGPAAASDGDGEVAELARAAQAVAVLMSATGDPNDAIARLVLQGQLPAFVRDAMQQAVTGTGP